MESHVSASGTEMAKNSEANFQHSKRIIIEGNVARRQLQSVALLNFRYISDKELKSVQKQTTN